MGCRDMLQRQVRRLEDGRVNVLAGMASGVYNWVMGAGAGRRTGEPGGTEQEDDDDDLDDEDEDDSEEGDGVPYLTGVGYSVHDDGDDNADDAVDEENEEEKSEDEEHN